MASATRTIRVLFTGDSAGLAAASLVARRNIEGYDKALTKIEKTMSTVRKAVAITGAAMVAAGTAAPILLAGASTLFVGLAAAGVASSKKVQDAFKAMGQGVFESFKADTSGLIPVALEVADKVGRAFARIQPILRKVFADAGFQQQIRDLTDGLLGLVENALPGLARAALAAGPAVRGLRDFLKDTGTAVSDFFDNLSKAGPQAGQVFDQLANLVSQLLPLMGELLAVATKFASGALPGLVGGLSAVLSPLSAFLSFIEPIAPFLGQVATAVIFASAALKVLGGVMITVLAAGAGFALLTGNLGAFAIRAVAAVAAFTPFGPAVARALGPMDRFTGVVGRVASLMSGATIAVVAASLAWDVLTVSSQEASDALKEGGNAAAAAAQGLATQTVVLQLLRTEFGGFGEVIANALDTITTTTDEFAASLDKVGKAQFAAAQAQAVYNTAVEQFGPTSEQARAAQEQLGLATDAVKKAQEDATAATKSHTQALIELSSTMAAQGNAALQYQQALLRIEEAQKAATDAVKKHGAASIEGRTATLQLQQSYLQAAEAAGKKAEADSASLGPQAAAKAGADAFRAELVRLAATTSGPARSSLLGLINNFDQSGISAVAADLKAKGFQVTLQRQPSGKETIVSVETAGAEARLAYLARDRVAHIRTIVEQTTHIRQGGKGLARGGPVFGPGSGTSDTAGLFALSNGEHVWTAREVRAAGGHAALERLRHAVLRGGMASGGGVGASGGVAVGPTDIRVFLGTREITDVIRTEIDTYSRETARRVGSGSGVTY
jgi:hypothetical protein